MGVSKAIWVPYALLGVGHVLAQAFGSAWPVVSTKVLLIPALAAVLLTLSRGGAPWRTRAVVALGCYWVGDIALEIPHGFGVGMAAFFAGHVAYVTAYRRLDGLDRSLWVAIPYVAWWLGLLVVFTPRLGWLVIAFAGYGIALGVNAVAAYGVNGWVAVGATSFLVSDSLIAVGEFLHRLPAHDVLVMVTYIGGQALIVYGLLRRSGALDQLDEHATGVLGVNEVDP